MNTGTAGAISGGGVKAVEVSGLESDLDFFLPNGLHFEDLTGCSCGATETSTEVTFCCFLVEFDVGGWAIKIDGTATGGGLGVLGGATKGTV